MEARGWRLGLDRMVAFCHHAGLDRYLGGKGNPNYIHIAGTNGKGSTCAFVEALLRGAGKRTGAFYSPYVCDYRERFQSGGNLISKEDLIRQTKELLRFTETFGATEYGGITKFEFEAALGFKYWGETGSEWVALEVGLGGRLDATNVVRSKCSIIVSIGLDHTSILGDSLEQIAFEKAGILKPKTPLVMGELPPEARLVVERRALELECPVWRFGREIQVSGEPGNLVVSTPKKTRSNLCPGLIGEMQAHNLALAIAAIDLSDIEIPDNDLRKSAREIILPGRFQEVIDEGVTFLIDGAHNQDAVEHLMNSLQERYSSRSPWVLVVNTLSGHDATAFYRGIRDIFESIEIPPISNPRGLFPFSSAEIAKQFLSVIRTHQSVKDSVEAAKIVAGKDGLVVVTGSNYLAGEVLNLIEG